jgi:hypothetical protein
VQTGFSISNRKGPVWLWAVAAFGPAVLSSDPGVPGYQYAEDGPTGPYAGPRALDRPLPWGNSLYLPFRLHARELITIDDEVAGPPNVAAMTWYRLLHKALFVASSVEKLGQVKLL